MLIGTLNQAFAAVKNMTREEVNTLTASIEAEGFGTCTDRRKKRAFCINSILFNWDASRWDITRMIYNAQAD